MGSGLASAWRAVPENFRLEEDDVATPGEGQVLLRTVYLSLDPYMRGRMSDEPSYSPPVDIGGVMVGGTVSRVVESNHLIISWRLGAGLQWMAGL